MQNITDEEFISMLHRLPDKLAYVNYLEALAASPQPPLSSQEETGG